MILLLFLFRGYLYMYSITTMLAGKAKVERELIRAGLIILGIRIINIIILISYSF